MLYLTQMLGRPVIDANGVEIGTINDIAIQTGEVFPRITSLAFKGPAKTPFMVSWRKYVKAFDGEKIELDAASHDIRFSYLQPDELLLARDLLNKQIVDTRGLKVVRVNDLKLSQSGKQLRLLGAEVGILGILRSLAPWLERLIGGLAKLVGRPLEENIIAWNYMDLVDRDLSALKLSVTHKRLRELHPADVADILEQLDPQQRAKVFEHLDAQQAAETLSELEDEYQTDLIDDMSDSDASELLASMDPDDAADVIGDLPYEKAEKLLWLMGVQDSSRIRSLLGYKEKTAGGIMTPEFVAVQDDATVLETIEKLRSLSEQMESVSYVYTISEGGQLSGALSLRTLLLAKGDTRVYDLSEHELITVSPDEDQEEVADTISKYDLLALPVVDENKRLLGIVTVDDAFDVLEEEHSEDLQIVGAAANAKDAEIAGTGRLLKWVLRKMLWFVVWVVSALLITMAGGLPTFAAALVLAPFVLLLADNSVTASINDLLEYGSKDTTAAISRLFVRNLVVAAVVVILGLLLSFALRGALDFSALNLSGSVLDGIQASSIGVACLAAVATAFVVLVSSVLITIYGRRRLDKDREISSVGVTLLVMLLSLGVQLGFSYLLPQLGVVL
ncbi:MAG: CBS domain-containing protein [Coriobacteriales bacterium]|jgi:Mg2+ transporter MgtE|nr:CBS domain-containing protein [Coriobacteriales bacterium]